MSSPTEAAPLLPDMFTRDELKLIQELMSDQLRNYGIVPWVFEDANVQVTRFPLEDVGQLPGLVIFSAGERYSVWDEVKDALWVDDPSGTGGEEIVFSEDQYIFPVQFHIEMYKDQRLRIGRPDDANYIEAANADEGLVMIKNILKLIFKSNFEYYDSSIPAAQGEFGWSSLSVQDISWAGALEGVISLDLFINFKFQNSYTPLATFYD